MHQQQALLQGALAQPAKQVVVQAEPANLSEGAPGVVPLGHAISPTPEPAPPKRAPAHYLWAPDFEVDQRVSW